jgi:hypothetical protein
MPAGIRLALALPGAVSLGAFEAGVAAALGVGLGALEDVRDQPDAPAVRLDVIARAHGPRGAARRSGRPPRRRRPPPGCGAQPPAPLRHQPRHRPCVSARRPD